MQLKSQPVSYGGAVDALELLDLEMAFAFAPESLTIDGSNLVSSYWHDLKRDTPARTWWMAASHMDNRAVSRALRVNPKDEGAAFGLLPFRLAKLDGRWNVLAAWPCPRSLGPLDMDWLGIEQVLAWDPVTDSVALLGDSEPALFGGFTDDDAGSLFGSPREFFLAWVNARAEFYVRWRMALMREWAHGAEERDLVPGALLVGEPKDIRWRPHSLPAALTCVGIDPTKVNRAILRAAHLPRAH